MNLGAGRIVLQDLPRIDAAIADGSLIVDPKLVSFPDALRKSGGAASRRSGCSGGVHSRKDQIAAVAEVGRGRFACLYALLDGRDTPPSSATQYLANLRVSGNVTIGTICGRYFAMDRDKRRTV